ncbi:MAG: TRAP transporter large permease subunit [Alphaproteobacteria bacterium]
MELVFLALLVLLMATALGSGFPVAFALPGSAILTIGAAALAGYLFAGNPSAYFAQGGPVQWLTAGVTNFRGIYWEVERDTLIAIPLFVFMGIMLQRSRIAEDLLIAMAQLFGPVPGGLGISVVFVGALLAATTGIVGATVVAMGLISLPVMRRNNYSNALATGTIAASGTLGQIIPPSIVLIILADQLASAVDQASSARKVLYKRATGEFSMPSEFDVVSTSAGDMFMGALIPGLVLVGAYMLFILIIALLRPHLAPAVPFEGKYDARFALRVLMTLLPPLTLILVVLGSIISGIATVNQAGAIGAVGATVMAGARLYQGRRGAYAPAALGTVSVLAILVMLSVSPINVKRILTDQDMIALVLVSIAVAGFVVSVIWSGWRVYRVDDSLRGVMVETAKTTSLVFIILLGAAMLTAAFRAFGGEDLVREFLTSLPGGFWTQFVIVMLVIFVLGFFLDFIEIAVVVVPIVAPILLTDPSANITAVWLGVMIGLNIQTSFLTPPFGFALFYLRGVAAAAVKTVEMYRGVISFICLQLLALAIVGATPGLVNYLPNRISLTAETAPPPRNPRLQYCLEQNVFAQYRDREGEIRDTIGRARALDIGLLPKKLEKGTETALAKAERTFELLEDIRKARAIVESQIGAYRPLHSEVRLIQRRMTGLETEGKALTRLANLLGETPKKQADEQALQQRIESIMAERKTLETHIPERWKVEHEKFRVLLKAEDKALKAYRKNVDTAYEPIGELVKIIADVDRLAALDPELMALTQQVTSGDPAEGVAKLAAAAKTVGAIAGTDKIKSGLSSARRALRKKTPDRDKAIEKLGQALKIYREELAWRQRAKVGLLPGLEAYETAIRDTIGIRLQSRLPREMALDLASCTAEHRDISLHF